MDEINDRDFQAAAERAASVLEELDDHAHARCNSRHDHTWAEVSEKFEFAAIDVRTALETLKKKNLLEPAHPDMRTGDAYGTFAGVVFWPMDPRSEEVTPEDIARALSWLCRWGRHCSRWYSVAEHSLRVMSVAMALATEQRVRAPLVGAYGLLHDAGEAYLTDIPRPVRRFIPGWLEIEERVHEAILERFALPPPPAEVAAIVEEADELLLAVEAHELFPENHFVRQKIARASVTPAIEKALAMPYQAWKPGPGGPDDWDEVAMLRLLRELLIARAVPDPKFKAAERDLDAHFGRGAWQENIQPRLSVNGATEAELRGEPPPHLKHLLREDP